MLVCLSLRFCERKKWHHGQQVSLQHILTFNAKHKKNTTNTTCAGTPESHSINLERKHLSSRLHENNVGIRIVASTTCFLLCQGRFRATLITRVQCARHTCTAIDSCKCQWQPCNILMLVQPPDITVHNKYRASIAGAHLQHT